MVRLPSRRQYRPTPVFLPGKLQGQKSLAGCSPGATGGGHDLATTQQPTGTSLERSAGNQCSETRGGAGRETGLAIRTAPPPRTGQPANENLLRGAGNAAQRAAVSRGEGTPEKRGCVYAQPTQASRVALVVSSGNCLLLMQKTQETWSRPLGWEEPRGRTRQPAAVFLPGEAHGQRDPTGYTSHRVTESLTRLK